MAYIRRGREDVENYPVENCHDGQGTIFVRQLLGERSLPDLRDSQDFGSDIRFMHETPLPAGTTIGPHPHMGNEELYYVVEGVGEMTVDGETFAMNPGSVCLTKSGSRHSFRNIGDSDLKIIVLEAAVHSKI